MRVLSTAIGVADKSGIEALTMCRLAELLGVEAMSLSWRTRKGNLRALTELIEDAKISPGIDQTYPFTEIPAAVRYQEEGHATGKVVVVND
ncbi:zinc-binding dehydrogenase [Nocardia vinacea]|nr:zinc-binding dehydrogenase [Nocardia vinacea]